jgi:hypothetical protein
MLAVAYSAIVVGIAVFIAFLFMPVPKSADDPPRKFKRGDKFPPT